jgi:membrane-associated tyrosine/threonine-specific cdc2-inhibitory kinase
MHERVPKHENLVEFICAWEEKDLLYIQTELCEMSLEKHLHEFSPLPEWRILDVLLDLAKAVYHLDCFDLVHADIKPANILVSFDGVCKLGDFGLMVDLNVVSIVFPHLYLFFRITLMMNVTKETRNISLEKSSMHT